MKGFFAVVRSKEFFAQDKYLFFIFRFYFIKIILCNFSDKCRLYPIACDFFFKKAGITALCFLIHTQY